MKIFGSLLLLILICIGQVYADNENWVKIVRRGGTEIHYDKNSVQSLSPDEKEVMYCVIDQNSNIIKVVRINKKNKQFAIGRTQGMKYGKVVSEMDFSKFGWVYGNIKPKSAEAILLGKLWK